jgi:hypothetical protein
MKDRPLAWITVDLGPHAPTREGVASHLGLSKTDIDATYGVVPLDVEGRMFSVMVAADRLSNATGPFQGPFADGNLSPFASSVTAIRASPPFPAKWSR